MKRVIIFLVFCVIVLPLFAQADVTRVAPGAEAQLSNLLNKPAMVKPAVAVPLGRNWFTLETDAHVFTDEVSVRQVAEVFLDIENQAKFFDGRRSKLTASRVSQNENGLIVDYVSIAIVPVVSIRLNTPYRASVRTDVYTDTKFLLDISQIPQDSETNGKIKNLYAPRYVEEVTINGKKYTYIRTYAKMDIDASILPGAKNTLERNSGPTNEEALQMVITAAKTK